MPIDHKAIVKEIDSILSGSVNLSGKPEELFAFHATMVSALRRLAPPGTAYSACVDGHEALLSNHTYLEIRQDLSGMVGVLTALRNDYSNGYLQSVIELVHADVFSDFLEMAHHLLEQGYKDPAAVVIGSVLESHLHKLCNKHGIPITNPKGEPKKADTLNADLKAAGAYGMVDHKAVTHWLDLRNRAAHGKYNEYTKDQIDLLLESVRNFLQRVPA